VARWVATLLLFLPAAAVSAEPVTDGFEAETLGPLWNPPFVTPGRVSVQRDRVHSGAAALRVEVREGDVAMVGADGVASERTELQEADRFGLYRDRMATPMVIYFDDYRKERLTP
jgi:hypothetical protein